MWWTILTAIYEAPSNLSDGSIQCSEKKSFYNYKYTDFLEKTMLIKTIGWFIFGYIIKR